MSSPFSLHKLVVIPTHTPKSSSAELPADAATHSLTNYKKMEGSLCNAVRQSTVTLNWACTCMHERPYRKGGKGGEKQWDLLWGGGGGGEGGGYRPYPQKYITNHIYIYIYFFLRWTQIDNCCLTPIQPRRSYQGDFNAENKTNISIFLAEHGKTSFISHFWELAVSTKLINMKTAREKTELSENRMALSQTDLVFIVVWFKQRHYR